MAEGYSQHVSLREYKAGAYGQEKQTILRSNLEMALKLAMLAAADTGRGRSTQVKGWKQVLEASQKGQLIEVVDD